MQYHNTYCFLTLRTILFVCGFTSHWRIFHSNGNVTIKGEGFKFWPKLGTHGHWAERVGNIINAPYLLWHGSSVYNGHLRGPVTFAPVTERLAVELSHVLLHPGIDFRSPVYEAHALPQNYAAVVAHIIRLWQSRYEHLD